MTCHYCHQANRGFTLPSHIGFAADVARLQLRNCSIVGELPLEVATPPSSSSIVYMGGHDGSLPVTTVPSPWRDEVRDDGGATVPS